MYHIKNDQRSIRSSEMLYDALVRLVQHKPFHTITVTKLVEEAQIGRATFYRNFDAIEDILRMRCDRTFEDLIVYIRAYLAEHQGELGRLPLRPVLHYFYQNSEIIEILMSIKRFDIIQDAFRQVMEPFKSRLVALHGVSEAYVEYGLVVRIGIMTNILTQWITSGKQPPPDELAHTLGHMMAKMITADEVL